MIFSAHRFNLPLVVPYQLSFASVRAYDTFYVVLEGDERIGLGEITPLPGYNHETPESVASELRSLVGKLGKGVPLVHLVQDMTFRAPFVASGIACAYETWREGLETAFLSSAPGSVPMAAFCGGDTPMESAKIAQQLSEQGYSTLKLKVGRMSPPDDAARIHAVAGVLPSGVELRLDANQAYAPRQAQALCQAIEKVNAVHLLEQPFRPEDWLEHEKLAAHTRIPIMLDESIWMEDDVRRAADCGAKLVKFKLCKHLGMAGSKKMIKLAFQLSLDVIYGNGVQSALGNHLETRVYHSSGLAMASESSGFIKLAQSPFRHRLKVRNGLLLDNGLENPINQIKLGPLVAQAEVRSQT